MNRLALHTKIEESEMGKELRFDSHLENKAKGLLEVPQNRQSPESNSIFKFMIEVVSSLNSAQSPRLPSSEIIKRLGLIKLNEGQIRFSDLLIKRT